MTTLFRHLCGVITLRLMSFTLVHLILIVSLVTPLSSIAQEQPLDPSLLEPAPSIQPFLQADGQENSTSQSSVVLTKVLGPGDDLIHGLIYHNDFLWASTRTSPARILKIDPNTLEYQKIILDSGLNEADTIVAAEGFLWVGLNTQPAKIIRVNPETLQWNVAITFANNEIDYANSLEYGFGYLWVGGFDRKVARINISTFTYSIYNYNSITSNGLFHVLKAGGGYIWASAVHYSGGFPYSSTIVRITPSNPTDFSSIYLDQVVPDDITYSNDHLYLGSEEAPSYTYKIAQNLSYTKERISNTGSYGFFSNPDNPSSVWGTYIGSPGRVIEFGPNMELKGALSLPTTFNDANEMVFDDAGYMYVTAWQRPAKIVKFQPTPCGQSPETDLDSCILQRGDILLATGDLRKSFQALRMVSGTYWFHAAIYLGNGQVAQATAPNIPPLSNVPAAEQVETTSLSDTAWWTGDGLYDWAVIRPTTTIENKDKAALYAGLKADQTNPDILYNINFFNKTREDAFYCSQLPWKAYQRLGLDLEVDKGLLTRHFGSSVTPDDLYYSVSANKATLVDETPSLGGIVGRWVFRIFSPADMLLTDPLGRRVGVDPQTGQIINEIPGASYLGGDSEPETLVVTAPDLDGTWTLTITGTGSGSYTFEAETFGLAGPIGQSTTRGTTPGKVDEFRLLDPETHDGRLLDLHESFLPLVRR